MAQTSHVLARKYRPQTFSDLIGQDVLVRTITNAIESNRLAHAYMLTGIRGIGKTSSARIIAKGLNCIGPDGKGGMTPNPCGKCRHCVDITNDAHIDVVEIDAASNTGVDNVRDIIIEGAKYNPVSARFKIYIIDEVHMLSKNAFNALLKTLEEPPERVKFIFATTEIRKVPVTILSRCQRFDLKRLDEKTLADYLTKIAALEKATIDNMAVQLISKAGDGSVRDALSLLDQAITHFDGNIGADQVRQMLGLADKTALFDLYENLMGGKIDQVLNGVNEQYESGADPLALLTDLLDLTHWLTRVKIMPDLAKDATVPEMERVRGVQMAGALGMAALTRSWQMLMKGLYEVKNADQPIKALEMVLIRLAFAAELPSVKEAIEDIKKNSKSEDGLMRVPVAESSFAVKEAKPVLIKEEIKESKDVVAEPKITVQAWGDVTELARGKNQRILAFNLEKCIRPVELVGTRFVCSLTDDAPHDLILSLTKFLNAETGATWTIDVRENGGGKTAKEEADIKAAQTLADLQKNPDVASILSAFKGAKIEKVVQNKVDNADASDADAVPSASEE